MNKITVDMSDWNNSHECELEFKMPNGLTIQFPRVYINELVHCTSHKEDYIRDKYGHAVGTYYNKLVDDISGTFNFTPLITDDGVQYREIREVKA